MLLLFRSKWLENARVSIISEESFYLGEIYAFLEAFL